MLSEAWIYLENRNGCLFDFRYWDDCLHLFIMIDRYGWVGVVESGCKQIYNDQNEYFLDLIPADYDICSFVRVGITSTYLLSGLICDILGYQRFI